MEYVPSAPETSKVPIAPMGKLLTHFARLSACTPAADASVNYSLMYVPQRRPVNSPFSLRLPRLTFCSFCSLFAGRWCRRLGRHSVNRELPDLLQHSYCPCARSSSKVPIAPMGDSLFAHCLQGGGVYIDSGAVTITSSSIYGNTAFQVRAHVQDFPSPRC
jgi:hypothetical protein